MSIFEWLKKTFIPILFIHKRMATVENSHQSAMKYFDDATVLFEEATGLAAENWRKIRNMDERLTDGLNLLDGQFRDFKRVEFANETRLSNVILENTRLTKRVDALEDIIDERFADLEKKLTEKVLKYSAETCDANRRITELERLERAKLLERADEIKQSMEDSKDGKD